MVERHDFTTDLFRQFRQTRRELPMTIGRLRALTLHYLYSDLSCCNNIWYLLGGRILQLDYLQRGILCYRLPLSRVRVITTPVYLPFYTLHLPEIVLSLMLLQVSVLIAQIKIIDATHTMLLPQVRLRSWDLICIR